MTEQNFSEFCLAKNSTFYDRLFAPHILASRDGLHSEHGSQKLACAICQMLQDTPDASARIDFVLRHEHRLQTLLQVQQKQKRRPYNTVTI